MAYSGLLAKLPGKPRCAVDQGGETDRGGCGCAPPRRRQQSLGNRDFLELERPQERCRHGHLLVEREPDQERERITRDQRIRLGVVGEVENVVLPCRDRTSPHRLRVPSRQNPDAELMAWQVQTASSGSASSSSAQSRRAPRSSRSTGEIRSVVIDIEEYRRLRGESRSGMSFKEFLLSIPKTDDLVIERSRTRRARSICRDVSPRHERHLGDREVTTRLRRSHLVRRRV